MSKKEIENIINEEVKNVLNEELSKRDLAFIREFIRLEVSSIFFDIYKKRNTWV